MQYEWFTFFNAMQQSLHASGENGPALETQSNSSLNSYIVTFILEIEDIEAAKAVKELKDKVKKYDIQYDFQDDIWDDIQDDIQDDIKTQFSFLKDLMITCRLWKSFLD